LLLIIGDKLMPFVMPDFAAAAIHQVTYRARVALVQEKFLAGDLL